MRDCQICGAGDRVSIMTDYDSQPCSLVECRDCGHRYVVFADRGQEWLDRYYKTRYRTDDHNFEQDRLDRLADFIETMTTDVLDIGGTDGRLQKRLLERGVKCDTAGVGEQYPFHDCIVLSHILEHVYDLHAFLDSISCNRIVIEVPIHLWQDGVRSYDYHWQHVNKFRPNDLETLIEQKGYSVKYSEQVEDYREYKVWRLAGIREGS